MKKHIVFPALASFLLLLYPTLSLAGDPTPEHPGELSKRMASIIKTHQSNVQHWAKNERIIQATREQNQRKMSLERIQELDRAWINGEAEAAPLVAAVQSNDAATYLKQRIESNPALYVEAFLCDEQGAVVAEYPKTTDYWQGDEDKFTESFNHGDGRQHIGPIQFDESTQTYSVQISIPVIDNNQTIGVLIVGLKNI